MAESSSVEQSKVQFNEGDVVYRKGDMTEQMFVVLSGRVRLYSADVASGAWSEELTKGDFFGEGSLLSAQPREATAVAMEKTELVSISRGTLLRMIRHNTEVAVKMMQGLAKKNSMLAAKVGQGAKLADEPTVAAQPESVKKQACLVSITSGQKYPIKMERALVGRSDALAGICPDIDLTNDDGHQTVSRQHACVTAELGRYFLKEESGAANGTFVHGSRLSPGEVREIHNGDHVGFGSVVLAFQIGDK
jgi:CRP-like cAMP-binding protein